MGSVDGGNNVFKETSTDPGHYLQLLYHSPAEVNYFYLL